VTILPALASSLTFTVMKMKKQILPILQLPFDGELLKLASMMNLVRTIRLLLLGL